ncbi:MAG: glycosyltransferase family 4 protein [Chitinophagaceae bacterium]|nr:glycosyltransferase family 4 protein [Chitinophagaceae bacterium]
MQKTFLFISTLEHLPWGGCEDLWYKTALIALKEGNEVLALVFKHDTIPVHIQQLQKAGAEIFFLERPTQRVTLFKKAKQKIFPNVRYRKVLEVADKKISNKNTTIIVSQAGGFDFSYGYLDEISEWLTHKNLPLYVIVQNVPDLGFTLSVEGIEKQKKIYNRAHKVFFVSDRNRISSERILAAHLDNATVVCNPLNVSLADKPSPFPTVSGRIKFAEVAALRCFHKGQDVLLQVLSGDQWKQRDWELNLFGEGPDKDYLKRLASFYGIEDRVHFHGHVKDIREVWRENHIHVLPSLGEGTPLALIESMYCGRPAITSDVGGNAAYCEDSICGFICDYPTPAALERVMEKAWVERGRWKEMGRKASEKINKDYNLEGSSTLYEFISA